MNVPEAVIAKTPPDVYASRMFESSSIDFLACSTANKALPDTKLELRLVREQYIPPFPSSMTLCKCETRLFLSAGFDAYGQAEEKFLLLSA